MRVLAVSAHPDDFEVSCGGTVIKLLDAGHEVRSICVSPCVKDVSGNRELEHDAAMMKLGLIDWQVYGYPQDRLEEYKQEIRDDLWQHRQKYEPQLVLCPPPTDIHQDHRTVAEICLTIFRDCATILGYEVLRSAGPSFNANVFVTFDRDVVNRKLRVLQCYKSQIRTRQYFWNDDGFLAWMKMRGLQAKAEYAEAFQLIWGRWD